MSVCFAVVTGAAAGAESGGKTAVFEWVGTHSYTIYLAQVVILSFPLYFFSALAPFVFIAASIGLGAALGKLVEQPFLQLRESIAPKAAIPKRRRR